MFQLGLVYNPFAVVPPYRAKRSGDKKERRTLMADVVCSREMAGDLASLADSRVSLGFADFADLTSARSKPFRPGPRRDRLFLFIADFLAAARDDEVYRSAGDGAIRRRLHVTDNGAERSRWT
jgi:hypothetical protein